MQKLPSEGDKAKVELAREVKTQGAIVGGFIGLLWVIQIVNALFFDGNLVGFGIHPRTLSGLAGILFAPLLHASFAHLIANTVPLAVLSFFVMLRRKRDLFVVSALSALVGGLGTWLIAPALSIHVGASILIFGLLGYLLSRGIFERRFWPVLGSIVVFFLYGGALFGVVPGQIGISWQGHLFGLLGGVLAARMLRKPRLTAADKSAPRRRIAALEGARIQSPRPGAGEERDADAEPLRARNTR